MYNFGAFQWVVTVPVEMVPKLAGMLTAVRPGVPNGSSFAITSDARPGYRNVYLSRASYEYITGPDIDAGEGTIRLSAESTID